MLPHHKITTFFNECKPWQTSLLEKGEHILFDLECFSLCTQQKKNELLSKKEEQNNNLPYAKNLFTSKIPDKKEDYEKIQKELKAASYVAIDTETDFGDPRKANVIGYSLCTNKANAWYIPLIIDNERVAQYNENRNLLEAIHTDAIIIMHNALFDLHALSRIRIFFKNKIFDTMLTAFFLKEKKIGLKELSSTLLKEKMESFFSVLTQYEAKTFDEIPLKEAKLYAATDARQTFLLYAYYQEKLLQDEHAKLREYLNTIEMPLIKVLFNIEQTGIYCSETALNKEEKKYLELLSKVKKELLEVAEKYGMESFNPASNKQTATLLYTHLGLSKVLKGTRTDNVTLKNIELHHPIISSIILYRSTLSNITHFTTGLKRHIESDNKIHTHYQQLSTVTGRITTMNPNLQSLPKKTSFINIREAFYCGKDNILVSFDYSQIEIHVLAALSQDPLLVGLLKNNEDIHTETATKLFNKEKKDITKEERQIGKKINFSVLYGQEAYSLSRELKISQAEAKNYLTIFKETYAGIFSWIEKITQEAIQKGFVETFYGNRRIIPELQDSNKIILKIGKRQSVNTIVQGTAAELMKKAMIAVYNYLENKQRGNIVLQIHDEILVEMKDDKNTDSVIAKITDIMEKVGDPLFDLKVAHTRGRTWS
jgi:DNA polymerase-1